MRLTKQMEMRQEVVPQKPLEVDEKMDEGEGDEIEDGHEEEGDEEEAETEENSLGEDEEILDLTECRKETEVSFGLFATLELCLYDILTPESYLLLNGSEVDLATAKDIVLPEQTRQRRVLFSTLLSKACLTLCANLSVPLDVRAKTEDHLSRFLSSLCFSLPLRGLEPVHYRELSLCFLLALTKHLLPVLSPHLSDELHPRLRSSCSPDRLSQSQLDSLVDSLLGL